MCSTWTGVGRVSMGGEREADVRTGVEGGNLGALGRVPRLALGVGGEEGRGGGGVTSVSPGRRERGGESEDGGMCLL